MDVNRAIRMAVDTGKVEFGVRAANKAALHGTAKLLVLAGNCPKDARADISHFTKLSGVQTITYSGTSMELGSLCGKPFPVAVLSIFEPGNSPILTGAAMEEKVEERRATGAESKKKKKKGGLEEIIGKAEEVEAAEAAESGEPAEPAPELSQAEEMDRMDAEEEKSRPKKAKRKKSRETEDYE